MEQNQDSKKICSVHCTMLLSMLLDPYHKLFRQQLKLNTVLEQAFCTQRGQTMNSFFLLNKSRAVTVAQ